MCIRDRIYTDVDGVYTTDPRVVPEARRLDRITFEEMLEMASAGSKVLQIRSVEFAGKHNVPLRVLSSFQEGPGTLITFEEALEAEPMEKELISGIAFNRDEAKLTVLGVPDRPGVAFSILGPVSDANIEVDMIIQNIGRDGTTDFTFTVHRNDYERTLEILRQHATQLGAREVSGDNKIAKLSLVGIGMRSHAGVASRMFEALAKMCIRDSAKPPRSTIPRLTCFMPHCAECWVRTLARKARWWIRSDCVSTLPTSSQSAPSSWKPSNGWSTPRFAAMSRSKPKSWTPKRRWPAAQWRCSVKNTATGCGYCAWATFPLNCAAAPMCAGSVILACSRSRLRAASQRECGGLKQ